MAAKPETQVVISKDTYEGLLVCQRQQRELERRGREASVQETEALRRQNDSIRKDLDEVPVGNAEASPMKNEPAAEKNATGKKGKGDEEEEEEEEEETEVSSEGDDVDADVVENLLPCKRKKAASAFLRRLHLRHPETEVKGGTIWVGKKKVGALAAVLGRLFGAETLSKRQEELVQSLLPRRKLPSSSSSSSSSSSTPLIFDAVDDPQKVTLKERVAKSKKKRKQNALPFHADFVARLRHHRLLTGQ